MASAFLTSTLDLPALRLRAIAAVFLAVTGVTALSIASRVRASQQTPPRASGLEPPLTTPTDIAIGSQVLHTSVQRFGINLSGQTFYDSGQLLKNLVTRNPGFEGETWQAHFRCRSATPTSCTEDDPGLVWPDHFLDHASFEVLSGQAKGSQGLVSVSSAGPNDTSYTLSFSAPVPHIRSGDFLQVHLEKPGNAQAGWWTSTTGGASLTTEFSNLPPNTIGKQALHIDASRIDQTASVSSYFDSMEGHSFVRLHGLYSLRFRARWLSGERALGTRLVRGKRTLFSQDVPLSSQWHNYQFDFRCNEDDSASGTVGLTFFVQQSAILLDDVQLVPSGTSTSKPGSFRDEVVATLRDLHPGILRFMDNGTSFGSTLVDLLAPPFARRRGGILFNATSADQIPIGLHESLDLAQSVGADPWYTLPATLSPGEAAELIEYLAAPSSTLLGSKRAASGQPRPWTSVFHTIHLEFGNEMWGTYPGANIADPAVYQDRSSSIFAAMTASPFFSKTSFDLIGNAQSENLWWTRQALRKSSQQTSIDFAPYLFSRLDDVSSPDAIFSAMLSEPEALDTTGAIAQQVQLLRGPHPLAPAVYEVNLGTVASISPNIAQSTIDATVASLGAGLAVVDHMLLMLRNLDITSQCFFALPEFQNVFNTPGKVARTTPLFGAVIDMGGATNRRRPVFYALQLANRALFKNELTTHLTGANPVWDQPAIMNSSNSASHPHLLQTFAFSDGELRSLILLNLSRSSALPVTFSGTGPPAGQVSESRLTARHITDTNEQQQNVSPANRRLDSFDPRSPYSLPPYSMTVLEWVAHK